MLDRGKSGEPDGDRAGDLGGELRRDAGQLLPGCRVHGIRGLVGARSGGAVDGDGRDDVLHTGQEGALVLLRG